MNPETIARLQKDVPELRELTAYIKNKMDSLNTIADIDTRYLSNEQLAALIVGRKLAHETLSDMLDTLVSPERLSPVIDSKEYVA